MAEPPPAKRQRLDMSTTFVVVVGKQKKEFMLHQSVATRSSKFFNAAMSREWKENQQKRVTLEEVQVGHFEIYLQWLSTNDQSFLEELRTGTLAWLYILGDFLDDSDFRTVLLELFVQRAVDNNTYAGSTIINTVWEHTPETSALRKIMVAIFTATSLNNFGERLAACGNLPKAFIVDCVRRLAAVQNPGAEISGEQRKRVLEACRDKIIEEQID